jgi:hypothetical protein
VRRACKAACLPSAPRYFAEAFKMQQLKMKQNCTLVKRCVYFILKSNSVSRVFHSAMFFYMGNEVG